MGHAVSQRNGTVLGKKDKVPSRGRPRWFVGPAIGVIVVILVGIVLTLTVDPFGLLKKDAPVFRLAPRTYSTSQPLMMTAVNPEFRGGRIYVDLAEIDKAGLVSFAVPGKTVTLPNGSTFDSLPVTVFAAPSGKVVAAVSFCEPCSGDSFHIRGNRLVCNVCGTEWSLEKLQGLAGGCLNYPPDEVSYTFDDGKLVLDEQALRAWVPRD